MSKILLWLAVVFLALPSLANAEKFVLKSGQIFSGQLLKYQNSVFKFQLNNGAMVYIKENDLLTISIKNDKTELLPSIAQIKTSPEKYLNQTVTLLGEFQGWTAAAGSPPVTRSDWVLKDNSGMIYVSGNTSRLNPMKDRGIIIETTGTVSRTSRGQVYLINKGTSICPLVPTSQNPDHEKRKDLPQ